MNKIFGLMALGVFGLNSPGALETAFAAKEPARRPLAPPPASFKIFSKVSALWAGNRELYCTPDRAIAETITEVRKLHEVRTASYDPRAGEIAVTLSDGTQGSIDIENAVPPGKRCLE
ncbi:MAG: hypothetical protein HY075_05035 [Deltaproteobacteria bacterium]|nr:hypothetical protein [Deltaproteobacteria bacterium]